MSPVAVERHATCTIRRHSHPLGHAILGDVPNHHEYILSGEWAPGFNAQNELLDAFAEANNLQEEDWRPSKPWYKK